MELAAYWKSSALICILLFNFANYASMCNITVGPENITFEVPPLKPEDYDCQYSWNNDSNVVLANHLECHPKILHQTITSLVIARCYNVTYKLNCR
uniref:Uncharacterized protein n=1 Tax=Knipowitschia caucasica TaxID=637954 RepID=A0AAV2JJW5_KNICA